MAVVILVALLFCVEWSEHSWVPADELLELTLFRVDMSGVASIYALGGWLLVGGAWVLLLTLFVVLELTRGLNRGALRAV